jgi:hypothetical protein
MMTCENFRDDVAELAVGSLDAPERADLLGHASSCATCQALLEQHSATADRLLEEVLEIEPPPGFEQRVLAQLGTTSTGSTSTGTTSTELTGRVRAVRWRNLALVACLLAAVAIASGAVVRSWDEREQSASLHTIRRGTIVRADGRPSGQVQVVDLPRPMLLVSIDHPRPFTGRVTCEMEGADGQRAIVGSWSYDDVEAGVWAVGLPPEWLHAVRMNVLDTTGKVLSSAALA